MSGKTIAEMTDDEIDALSDAELEEQLTGDPVDDEEEADEGEGDDAGDDGDGEDEGDDADDADEGGDDAGDEDEGEDEAERLQRLADEGGGDRIPRGRLNEVLRERDTYREIALEALRSGKVEPAAPAQPAAPKDERPTYDVKAGMREYTKLLAEGDEEGATAKLEEVEAAREEIRQYDLKVAEENAYKRVAADKAKEKLDDAVAEAHEAYPFLNEKSPKADPDLIMMVNAKARALIAEGKAPHVAIRQASKAVAEKFGPKVAASGDKSKGDKAKEAGDARTASAVRRGLEVRQPATAKAGVGNRETGGKIDISKMTDKQIDGLSESELNEALGITD